MYLNLKELGVLTEDKVIEYLNSLDLISEIDFRKDPEKLKRNLLKISSDYIDSLDYFCFIKFPRSKTISKITMNAVKDFLIYFKDLPKLDKKYFQSQLRKLSKRSFNCLRDSDLGFIYSEYLLYYLSDINIKDSLNEMIWLTRVFSDSRIRKNYYWLLDFIKTSRGERNFITLFTYNKECLKTLEPKIKEDEEEIRKVLEESFRENFENYNSEFKEKRSSSEYCEDSLIQNLFIKRYNNDSFLKTYRDQIDLITFSSNKGEIRIRKKDNHYYILWDSSYWNLFDSFLHSVLSIASKKTGRTKSIPGLNEGIPEFFLYNIYFFLLQRQENQNGKFYKVIENIFSQYYNFLIHLNMIQEQEKETLYDFAKIFIFFEELDVISLDLNNLRENFNFFEIITYLISLIQDNKSTIITNYDKSFREESLKILTEPEFDYLRREIFIDFSSYLKTLETLSQSNDNCIYKRQLYQNLFRSSLIVVQFEAFISEITDFIENLENLLKSRSTGKIESFYQEYKKELKSRWYYHKFRQELFSTLIINYISQNISDNKVIGLMSYTLKNYCSRNDNLLKVISFIEEEIVKQLVGGG